MSEESSELETQGKHTCRNENKGFGNLITTQASGGPCPPSSKPLQGWSARKKTLLLQASRRHDKPSELRVQVNIELARKTFPKQILTTSRCLRLKPVRNRPAQATV